MPGQFTRRASPTSAPAWIRRTRRWWAVVMDVRNLDALNAVMQSTAAAEAMAHEGVAPETLVILVEAKPRCKRPEQYQSTNCPAVDGRSSLACADP